MSILTIIKLILIVLSGGLFAPPHSKEKIIAGIIVMLGVTYTSYDSIKSLALKLFSSPIATQTSQAELLHWESALKLHTTTAYQDYLSQYPNGEYKIQAEQAILALSATQPKQEILLQKQTNNENQWQTINRYSVKDDLVKDNETGLMWMRCSLGQNWNGITCEGDAKEYTWADAMKLNNTSDSHYNDWRLPTIEQLKTLVYCSSGKPTTWNSSINIENWLYDGCTKDSGYTRPTIYTEVFPNMSKKALLIAYWSSSPVADVSNGAWIVDFSDGYEHWSGKFFHLFVRLVRGGQ